MNLWSLLVRFSVMLHRYRHLVAAMRRSKVSHIRNAMDSRLLRTSLEVSLEDRVRALDQRADNEDCSRTAVVHAAMREMRLANRWVRMDTFRLLRHLLSTMSCDDDEYDEADCCS